MSQNIQHLQKIFSSLENALIQVVESEIQDSSPNESEKRIFSSSLNRQFPTIVISKFFLFLVSVTERQRRESTFSDTDDTSEISCGSKTSDTAHISCIENKIRMKYSETFGKENEYLTSVVFDPIHLLLTKNNYFLESSFPTTIYARMKEISEFILWQIKLQNTFDQFSEIYGDGHQTQGQVIDNYLNNAQSYLKRFSDTDISLHERYTNFLHMNNNAAGENITFNESSLLNSCLNSHDKDSSSYFSHSTHDLIWFMNQFHEENSIAREIRIEDFEIFLSETMIKISQLTFENSLIELDGSIMKEVFTPLNLSNSFQVGDVEQKLIYQYILLFWCTGEYLNRGHRIQNQETLQNIVSHLQRILHQVSIGISRAPVQVLPLHEVYIEIILIQTIHLLGGICETNVEIIALVAPRLKQFLQLSLSSEGNASILSSLHLVVILDFFIRHSNCMAYDTDAIVKQFFQEIFPRYMKNDKNLSYYLILFCRRRREILRERNIFLNYRAFFIDLILNLVEVEAGLKSFKDWRDLTLENDKCILVSPFSVGCMQFILTELLEDGTYWEELFHLIVDLPIQCIAKRRSSWNNPILNHYAKSTSWNEVQDSKLWTSAQNLGLKLMNDDHNLCRAIFRIVNTCIILLEIFFEIVNQTSTDSSHVQRISSLTMSLISRVDGKHFDIPFLGSKSIATVLLQNCFKYLHTDPSRILTMYKEVTSLLHSNIDYILAPLCSVIGTSLLMCDSPSQHIVGIYFSHVKELILKKIAQLQMMQNKNNAHIQSDVTNQLLNSISTCLGKIGATEPDLIPSIVVCLREIYKIAQILHPSTKQQVTMQLLLLKTPNLARTLYTGKKNQCVMLHQVLTNN